MTRWMVDDREEKNMCMYNKKLGAAIAWGSCIISEASKMTEGLSGAMFGSPGDIHNFGEWELKSNGMLCRDGCRYCAVRKDGELVMDLCGIKKPKKHIFSKVEFDINPNLIHFQAMSVESAPFAQGVLKRDPKTNEIKRCGLSQKGEFINDIFPVSARRVVCSQITDCVFEEDVAECVPGEHAAGFGGSATGTTDWDDQGYDSDGPPTGPQIAPSETGSTETGSSGTSDPDDPDEPMVDKPCKVDENCNKIKFGLGKAYIPIYPDTNKTPKEKSGTSGSNSHKPNDEDMKVSKEVAQDGDDDDEDVETVIQK